QLSYDKMKDKLLDEMKKTFRPEFVNRLDGVVVFHTLTKENINNIVEMMLSQVQAQLVYKDIKLEVTEAAKELLGQKGYDPAFGARPLRREIERRVEDPLSEGLLNGKFQPGETVQVDSDGEEIVLHSAVLANSSS
ncbi:NDP-hexose 4-ketoreductase, partial [Chloroflexota bacterium]